MRQVHFYVLSLNLERICHSARYTVFLTHGVCNHNCLAFVYICNSKLKSKILYVVTRIKSKN